MTPKSVFLCYDHVNDGEHALRLRNSLVSEGIPVWWDHDIGIGEHDFQKIDRAIKDCRAFLFCLSAEALKRDSSGIYLEVKKAAEVARLKPPGTIFIIPVKFSECEVPDLEISGDQSLQRFKPVDLFPDEKWESAVRRLAATLGEKLNLPMGGSIQPAGPPSDHDEGVSSAAASQVYPRGHALRAVVFTHFGALKYRDRGEEFIHLKNQYEDKYTRIFRAYYACRRTISKVYVYVDWAFRRAITKNIIKISEDGTFAVPMKESSEENELKGMLNVAIDAAQERAPAEQHLPIDFEIIGIDQLRFLLHKLFDLDPDLIKFLCGPKGKFTYDSPKFVEAIIRLSYGDSPLLAKYPIVRIDEDAIPNNPAIRTLVTKYEKQIRTARFFFFSGSYGVKDRETVDYLNDFAVRTHWFAPIGASENLLRHPPTGPIRHFLADLDALGPMQFSDSRLHYSQKMKDILDEEPGQIRRERRERPSTQVISGAGLIMSSRSVRFLPPFMNFEFLTTWVDDHLKRRLHEALEDIGRGDVECVKEAKFEQDRHPLPKGVQAKEILWAVRDYFDRLVRGCILRRIITNNDGTPTDYSNLIAEIVRFRVTGVPPAGVVHVEGLLDVIRTRVEGSGSDLHVIREKVDLDSYRPQMLAAARQRYEEVMRCWSSEDYRGPGAEYASALHDWAVERRQANETPSPFFATSDYLVQMLLSEELSHPETDFARYLATRFGGGTPAGRGWIQRLNDLLEDESLYKEFGARLSASATVHEQPVQHDPRAKTAIRNRELLEHEFLGVIPWWNHKERTCQTVVDDALAYVRLLLNWHKFVRAVEQLSKTGIDWLNKPFE